MSRIQGQRLQEWRKGQGWTQQALAVKLNVSLATVARWEKGDVEPSPLALDALKRLGFKL